MNPFHYYALSPLLREGHRQQCPAHLQFTEGDRDTRLKCSNWQFKRNIQLPYDFKKMFPLTALRITKIK